MLKKLVIGLLILIVIVAAGAWYTFSNLDHFIKVAIEKYGTAATQADVSLSSVTLSLTSGQGSLNGLSVGNPKGFSSAKSLSLGSVSVQVDTSSLRGNGPIVIREIDIEKPEVSYEIANDGSSNLQTISRNTQNYAKAMSSGHAASSAPASTPENANAKAEQGRKMIITDLIIRNGQVGVSQAMFSGKSLSAPLPAIHLTNIGKSSGGATAAQIAEEVLGTVTQEAAKVASSQFAGQLEGQLKGAAGSALGGAKGITDVDGIGGSIKNLIGQ
jgi:hypothetical protein